MTLTIHFCHHWWIYVTREFSVGYRKTHNTEVTQTQFSLQFTCEFEKYSHQKSLFSPTNITEEIYHTAVELFAQMWKKEPIRLIGLSTSKATSDQTYQYDLFHKDQYERLSKLNSALDSIRDKYGSGAVKRACFLKEEDWTWPPLELPDTDGIVVHLFSDAFYLYKIAVILVHFHFHTLSRFMAKYRLSQGGFPAD